MLLWPRVTWGYLSCRNVWPRFVAYWFRDVLMVVFAPSLSECFLGRWVTGNSISIKSQYTWRNSKISTGNTFRQFFHCGLQQRLAQGVLNLNVFCTLLESRRTGACLYKMRPISDKRPPLSNLKNQLHFYRRHKKFRCKFACYVILVISGKTWMDKLNREPVLHIYQLTLRLHKCSYYMRKARDS